MASLKTRIVFTATTPFAVNAFLTSHLQALAKNYDVLLCVNLHAYALTPALKNKVRVFHIDFARKIAPIHDVRALLQLLWVLWRERPAAIHSITPKAGLLSMLAASLLSVPHRYHTFTGQVWANRRGLSRSMLKSFDRWIFRLATRVLADSPSQCRLLENEKIVREGVVSVLGLGSISGVDLERFHPDRELRDVERVAANTPPSTRVYLFVGRLARDKGVFDLLAAFSSVASGNDQVELWMVGPDDEGLLPQLQEMAGRGVGRVRWVGATPQPERYMAAADIFVLPSYREGFGSVIIEAAACGIPSIAYRIDGVVDAVLDGHTGILVPERDVDALALAMRSLAVEDQRRSVLGRQARIRAVEEYSSTRVTAAWLGFYARELYGVGGDEFIG